MSFWGELKRRNVYKVGVAYAIVAWLLIQAAAIIFPHLNLPSWAVTFVIVILIIGFPLILLFAWAFEITPEGIKRTKQVPLAESITHLTGQKLNYIVTGLLVVAVAFILFDNYYLDRRAVQKEIASIEPEQAPVVSDVEEGPKTIAVLPFTDISPEKDQEYFVDGLSEEIINCLTQISDLHVTSRQSSFTFKNSDKTTQEIAEILGGEYILEGSVRKVGKDLRITAQLIHVADDRHLWSKSYDRKLEDIFAIQENIAKAVANELGETLGIERSFRQLGGTDNVEAYELYLIAKGLWIHRGGPSDMNPLGVIDAAIAVDPEFALAWATKANLHVIPPNMQPDAGLQAAQRAIEIEPNLAEAYSALGGVRMVRREWIEAEVAFRKALELTTEPILGNSYYNQLMMVGHLKKAHEELEAQLLIDPLTPVPWDFYITSSFLMGDTQRAEEEIKRAKEQFGNQLFMPSWSHNTTLNHLGAGEVISRDEITCSDDPICDAAKEHFESPEEALAELRRLYNDGNVDFGSIAIWAAYFRDPEFAMDAMEKGVSNNAIGLHNIWYPVYHELRQTPRFKEFVKEIGLVDYWEQFGWPDICHQLDNRDFECD